MERYYEWRKRIDEPIDIAAEVYKNIPAGSPILGRDSDMLGLYISIKGKREGLVARILEISKDIDRLDSLLVATGLTVSSKNLQEIPK